MVSHRCFHCGRLNKETLECIGIDGKVWVDFKDQFHVTDANKLKRYGKGCIDFVWR